VSVQHQTIGSPVRDGFLGLGLEYRTVPAYGGTDPKALNPVFVQLIHNLSSGQHPVFRIGGISTDRTWWPIRGMRRSPGITYNLSHQLVALIKSLAVATDGRLILGINLEDGSTRVASAEVKALRTGIGSQRILAYELGNEPELYTGIAWYAKKNGHDIPWFLRREGTPVYSRPAGYNFRDFTFDFTKFRKALGHVPLAGPSTGNSSWLTGLTGFLGAEPGLRVVTFHRYGLNLCVKDRTSAHYPTVPHLLTTLASRGLMDGVGRYIGIAHRHHAAFMLDEMNSVTCNGKAGVSNTQAAALWALDALFNMAKMGVDGVQIHTFQGNPNGLFDFKQSHGHWLASVHAPYYGLLLFAQAAPAGSRLLRIVAPRSGAVRSWATVATDGTVRVVLINDNLRGTTSVTVRPPAAATSATVTRLRARSAYSTSGLTLGGRGFGSRTTTGSLAVEGSPLTGGASGYALSLPAASAAMVTFTK
jgi:hypothetical protein